MELPEIRMASSGDAGMTLVKEGSILHPQVVKLSVTCSKALWLRKGADLYNADTKDTRSKCRKVSSVTKNSKAGHIQLYLNPH